MELYADRLGVPADPQIYIAEMEDFDALLSVREV